MSLAEYSETSWFSKWVNVIKVNLASPVPASGKTHAPLMPVKAISASRSPFIANLLASSSRLTDYDVEDNDNGGDSGKSERLALTHYNWHTPHRRRTHFPCGWLDLTVQWRLQMEYSLFLSRFQWLRLGDYSRGWRQWRVDNYVASFHPHSRSTVYWGFRRIRGELSLALSFDWLFDRLIDWSIYWLITCLSIDWLFVRLIDWFAFSD